MGLRINGKGKVETDSQLESPQDCLTELGMTGPEAEEQLVPLQETAEFWAKTYIDNVIGDEDYAKFIRSNVIPSFDAAPTLSPFQEYESKLSAEMYENLKIDSEELKDLLWKDYKQVRRQIWIRWLKLEVKSLKRDSKQALTSDVAWEEPAQLHNKEENDNIGGTHSLNYDLEPLKRTLKELTAETEDLACKYAILNEFHKVKREHKDMRQRYEKMQAAVLRLENQE